MDFHHRPYERGASSERQGGSSDAYICVNESRVAEHPSTHEHRSKTPTEDLGMNSHGDLTERSCLHEPPNLNTNRPIAITHSTSAQHEVVIHSLKTEDTLIIDSEPKVDAPESSGGQLKGSLTRMPSSFCDLRSPTDVKHLPDAQHEQRSDMEYDGMKQNFDFQTVSNDNEAVRQSLKTEDTLIIDSEPGAGASIGSRGHLKGSITRMPSSFCDLRSSMRSNESLQLHHNLTLLLETTRVAISHDEKEIEELNRDIRRLRKKCFTDSVQSNRLATRWRNIADVLCTLVEQEGEADTPNC